MKEKASVFVRLGITLTASREEISKVMQGDSETFWNLIAEKKYEIDGDSYIPEAEVWEYENLYGEDCGHEAISF